MKTLLIFLSAFLGFLTVTTAGYLWGNHFLDGGYKAFTWPYGWGWPLAGLILLWIVVVAVFKALCLRDLELSELLLRSALPFAIGATVGALAFVWFARQS